MDTNALAGMMSPRDTEVATTAASHRDPHQNSIKHLAVLHQIATLLSIMRCPASRRQPRLIVATATETTYAPFPSQAKRSTHMRLVNPGLGRGRDSGVNGQIKTGEPAIRPVRR
jgi:hypothetical protein